MLMSTRVKGRQAHDAYDAPDERLRRHCSTLEVSFFLNLSPAPPSDSRPANGTTQADPEVGISGKAGPELWGLLWGPAVHFGEIWHIFAHLTT
jgi:hypothetical protein